MTYQWIGTYIDTCLWISFCSTRIFWRNNYIVSTARSDGQFRTYLPLNKMAAISQTTFSNAFLWTGNICILIRTSLKFVLKVQLTISQCWCRQWLRTEQTTMHYMKHCWPSSLTPICGTRVRWAYVTCWVCLKLGIHIKSHWKKASITRTEFITNWLSFSILYRQASWSSSRV